MNYLAHSSFLQNFSGSLVTFNYPSIHHKMESEPDHFLGCIQDGQNIGYVLF